MGLKSIAELNHDQQYLCSIMGKIVECGVSKRVARSAADENNLLSLVDIASVRAAKQHNVWGGFSEKDVFLWHSDPKAERKKESERVRDRASKEKKARQVRYTHFYSALNFGLCINAIFTCIVHIYYRVHCGCIVVLANFQTILCPVCCH